MKTFHSTDEKCCFYPLTLHSTDEMTRYKNAYKATRITNGDGTIRQTIDHFKVATASEDFVFMFKQYMRPFYELRAPMDIHLMLILAGMLPMDDNRISLSPVVRKMIMDTMGWTSTQSVSNALNRLKDKGLIYGGSGDYQINPYMFWRGQLKNRQLKILSGGLPDAFLPSKPKSALHAK